MASSEEIVNHKLRKAVAELEVGIETSDTYTVEVAVRDWLARGTRGLSAKTINHYKSLAESNPIPFIGAYKLKELTADNVDDWLEDRRDHLTTRTLQAIHSILRRPYVAFRRGTRSSATWQPWSTPQKAERTGAPARP